MLYCMKCGTKLVKDKCPSCDSLNMSKKKRETVNQKKKKVKPKTIKEKPTGKKKTIIITVCLTFGVIIAGGAVALGLFFSMDSDYNDAIALLENSEPKQAAEIFEGLNSFKESESYLMECNLLISYTHAVETMQDEDFTVAVGMFAALGDYGDSQELMQLSQNNLDYEKAGELFDFGDFEQAQTIFVALADFQDSSQLAHDCQVRLDYAKAAALFEAGENLAAKDLFETIIDFNDSKKLAMVCGYRLTYDDAVKKIEEEDFKGALELLNGIKQDVEDYDIEFIMVMDYTEFDAVRNDCYRHIWYNKGKSLFDEGLFYSAYINFSSASGLLDADELAQSCAQPIVTKELYENPDYAANKVSVTFYAPKESGNSVCVKIYSGSDLASTLLIKAGEKLRIKLPDGMFSFNIGKGITWYGEKEFFGDDGYYGTLIINETDTTFFRKLKLLIPFYAYTFRFEVEEGDYPAESISQSNF